MTQIEARRLRRLCGCRRCSRRRANVPPRIPARWVSRFRCDPSGIVPIALTSSSERGDDLTAGLDEISAPDPAARTLASLGEEREHSLGAPALPGSLWSELESSAGGHHRRPPRVDGGDDLLRVDALEVDAGGAEVGMPELALDDVGRHALARQLERVRVAQLVRREPVPDTGADGDPPELGADSGGRPGRPRVRPSQPASEIATATTSPPPPSVSVPSCSLLRALVVAGSRRGRAAARPSPQPPRDRAHRARLRRTRGPRVPEAVLARADRGRTATRRAAAHSPRGKAAVALRATGQSVADP